MNIFHASSIRQIKNKLYSDEIKCVIDAEPTTPRYRYRSNEGQTGV
jgi:hypothetical protein